MLGKILGLWAFLLPFILVAQQKQVDSLLKVLATTKEDTTRLNIYLEITVSPFFKDGLKYLKLAQQLDDTLLAKTNNEKEKRNLIEKKASILTRIGYNYKINVEYRSSEALELDMKSLSLYKEVGDAKGVIGAINEIASDYELQGDILNELEYYESGLEIARKNNFKEEIRSLLSSIANIYFKTGDTAQGLSNLEQSISNTADSNTLFRAFINIAQIYGEYHDSAKATYYYNKARNLYNSKYPDWVNKEISGSMAEMYFTNGNYKESIEYFQKCLQLEKIGVNQILFLRKMANAYMLLGDNNDALTLLKKAILLCHNKENEENMGATHYIPLGWCSLEIAKVYMNTGKYRMAKKYSDTCVEIMKKGMAFQVAQAEEIAASVDSANGEFKSAYLHYQQYIVYRDKLKGEEAQKKLLKEKIQNEYEKKAAANKADQAKKDALAAEEAKKQKIIMWSVMAGMLIVLIFAGFVVRSLRITRKQKGLIEIKNKETEQQKALIEQQKILVEEKNKDILDSITYAKRLQDAILPPLGIIKKYLPDSFLLYKPKDIVAGDFYWMERAGDNLLIAACDCTGHGVPGAMVSVVCSNALNRAVKEFKITEPGKILDKVRELVLETFEKSESEVKDGMDVSLCCINSLTLQIQWSGAYNPLWYIQSGNLNEVTPDKQPIGKNDNPVPFNTNGLKLNKGDNLYLFTDGYADQFGGPKGKKFKYRQMQELLLANANKPMEEQGKILNETIEAWKGNLEQIDDILIIGIRV